MRIKKNIWHDLNIPTFCVKAEKVHARLHGCSGSSEHSLVSHAISTQISRADLFLLLLLLIQFIIVIKYSTQTLIRIAL